MSEPARYIAFTKSSDEIENTFAIDGNTTLDELFEKLRELNIYKRAARQVTIHRDAIERHREMEEQFAGMFGVRDAHSENAEPN